MRGLRDVGRALFGGVQVERVNVEGIANPHQQVDFNHIDREIFRQSAYAITPCASTLAQGERDFVVLDLHRHFSRGLWRGACGQRLRLQGWRYVGHVLGG